MIVAVLRLFASLYDLGYALTGVCQRVARAAYGDSGYSDACG